MFVTSITILAKGLGNGLATGTFNGYDMSQPKDQESRDTKLLELSLRKFGFEEGNPIGE